MVLQCNNGVGSNPVEGRTKKLTALKSNSNTVWFNFQTYIIFSINLVSFKVTLRSSGTDILYGCHLLLDVCIIYFISCDCIVNNSSLSYPIYLTLFGLIFRRIYIYIYIRLKINFRAVKFVFFPRRSWNHTTDTLQHLLLSLTSSALDHSTTSTT